MFTLSARTLAITAIAAATSFSASSAFAENLLASATRSGNATGAATTFVALTNSGATSLPFNTSADNKLVKISYNAECAISAGVGNWASVRILVDGVEANPASGTSFALCTASVANTFIYAGNSRQSLISIPVKGPHAVQVQVASTAGIWWLGDSSIVVEQK